MGWGEKEREGRNEGRMKEGREGGKKKRERIGDRAEGGKKEKEKEEKTSYFRTGGNSTELK